VKNVQESFWLNEYKNSMLVIIGFRAITKKALIHAPGDGFQLTRLLVLSCFGTARIAKANQRKYKQENNELTQLSACSNCLALIPAISE
jgi:hypothetical protein